MDVYDITIIGAGPTGLFATYYAGFRALRTKIIDSQSDLGGQVTALYPDKYIYDVAGFPKILGKDLIRNQIEQMMQYNPTVVLNERVERLDQLPDGTYKLTTHTGQEHFTRVVLIAAGIGAFTPKRYNRPELDRWEGRGLEFAVRNREDYRGKRVLVVGGGDSALDWALNLLPLVQELTLIHRRDQFRAHEDSVRKLLSSPARVKLFYELKALQGRDRVEAAVIFNNRTSEEEVLEVDAVLAFLGLVSDLGPIREWGLELYEDSIVVNTKMETNRPGIYAAGDVTYYPGKLKLIATGYGEAATAVNNAYTYLHPGAKAFPGHSSAIMEKKEKEAAKAGGR
ncbi:MAG: NAD(P)/FAD-dependent oxidoreductase [Armatimonadetes bacterium]|nr:NAD(P)/FAD-dependent oxidoreductase [Armatimonadota bacterium]MDW8153359.1 NAD(P)/FAD-dependent oxidoreductase [Armatimonadota bacterium]